MLLTPPATRAADNHRHDLLADAARARLVASSELARPRRLLVTHSVRHIVSSLVAIAFGFSTSAGNPFK
jgi:hypothetical protein